jgi:hypothetical protein
MAPRERRGDFPFPPFPVNAKALELKKNPKQNLKLRIISM